MNFKLKILRSHSIPSINQYFLYENTVFKIIEVNTNNTLPFVRYCWYNSDDDIIMVCASSMTIGLWLQSVKSGSYILINSNNNKGIIINDKLLKYNELENV